MCPDRQILSLYIDNELPSPWKEKTENHLASCETCRLRYEEYRKLEDAMLMAFPAAQDDAVKKAQETVWAKFPSAMVKNTEEQVFSLIRNEKTSGWKRTISLPIPAAAAAAAVFIIAALFAIRGFTSPAIIYEPVKSIVSDQWIGNDSANILQYISSHQDSSDYMVIQLPESRNFYSSGEPTLLRKADYSRSIPQQRRRAISP